MLHCDSAVLARLYFGKNRDAFHFLFEKREIDPCHLIFPVDY